MPFLAGMLQSAATSSCTRWWMREEAIAICSSALSSLSLLSCSWEHSNRVEGSVETGLVGGELPKFSNLSPPPGFGVGKIGAGGSSCDVGMAPGVWQG